MPTVEANCAGNVEKGTDGGLNRITFRKDAGAVSVMGRSGENENCKSCRILPKLGLASNLSGE